jgi:CBS domain-containing protein
MDDVSSLVETKTAVLDPADRLARIALVLSRTRCNAAPVARGDRFLGCVMRRQLLRPPLAPDTKAERLLSHPPILRPDTRIEDAVALVLQSGCDLLPVADGERLLGMVSARDIAHSHADFVGLSLSDVAEHLAPPVPAGGSISEAATALRELNMESLPLVAQAQELSGWITFARIHPYLVAPEKGVRGTGEFIGEKERPYGNPIAPLATKTGLTSPMDLSLPDAIDLLRTKQSNELTVVEKSRVLGHLNVLGIIAASRRGEDILVQVTGLDEEEPAVAMAVTQNLKAAALKIARSCREIGTPELKVKTYEHRGSKRRRYDVRVSFSLPERYVAEAKGWDLLPVTSQALKKVEREISRSRSKLIDLHKHRRKRSQGESE